MEYIRCLSDNFVPVGTVLGLLASSSLPYNDLFLDL